MITSFLTVTESGHGWWVVKKQLLMRLCGTRSKKLTDELSETLGWMEETPDLDFGGRLRN
jgi:hypothetical protein